MAPKVSKPSTGEAKAKAKAKAAPPVDKNTVCNFLTTMKHTDDQSKAAIYDHYKGLGRFDAEKMQIIARWKLDKTCKWATSDLQERTKIESSSSTSLSGFGARFDVGKALNMEDNSPLLDEILEEMGHDEDWDSNNVMERIFMKKGLKRYKLEGLKQFNANTSEEVTKEIFSASTDGASSSKPDLLSACGSGGSDVKVKVENPNYQKLQEHICVVKSGKTSLEKEVAKALDFQEAIQVKMMSDASLQTKVNETKTIVETAEAFMKQIRSFLAQTDILDKSSDVSAVLPKAQAMADMAVSHFDGLKAFLKRNKPLA